MKQFKTIISKLLILIFLLVFITGCSITGSPNEIIDPEIPTEEVNQDQIDLDNAHNNLSIIFSNSNHLNFVTSNIELLEYDLQNNVSITWISSNLGIVANNGIITRPGMDLKVTLTATLTKNGYSLQKTFELLIIGTFKDEVVEAYDDLIITFEDETNNSDYVTSNLVLVNKGLHNTTVVWVSSNPEVIDHNGIIKRSNEDIVVEITAYIFKGSIQKNKTFELIVIEDEIKENLIDENGLFNQKDEVALYIKTYQKLPSNYITKSQVNVHIRNHWTPENKASVGGDIFNNRERLLPIKVGRIYYEADINYQGQSGRNAERIVFSNDGLIFYTSDHYESFIQYNVESETWILP